jgi:hypothetical protein
MSFTVVCAHRFRAEKGPVPYVSNPTGGSGVQPYSALPSANHRDVALLQDRIPARCPDFALTPLGRSIKFRAVCLGSTVFIC